MSYKKVWPWLVVVLTCEAALAQQEILNVSQQMGPEPQSTTRQFPITVKDMPPAISVDVKVALSQGRWRLRLSDQAGKPLISYGTTGTLTKQDIVRTRSQTTFQLEVITDRAVGDYTIQVSPAPGDSAFQLNLITGPAMILVALVSVLYWRARSKALWRWFWVGAGVWSVGVGLKVAWAFLLNGPILQSLGRHLPSTWYLAFGSLYIGLLTGVFEIGVTLAIALIWRRLAANAGRAVAVGVGAGAFEAVLLGVGGFVSAVALISGTAPGAMVTTFSRLAPMTPVFWLVGPVERFITVLCHTSSRTLTLLTVATGRWSFFWWGFAIMTAIDAVAGYFHLSGKLMQVSTWWIELAIAPAAIVSVPIIRWCVHHWPTGSAADPDAALEAEVTREAP